MKLSITLAVVVAIYLIGHSNGVIRKSYRDFFATTVRGPPIPKPQSNKAVILEYIDQRVDNFNPQNSKTYKMRYYRNDEHFKAGGPILIEVGGEWTISAGSLRGGLMFDLAKELNAQMFYTEHRYYGKSIPTPDASTSNLRYLSVDQALADLAHFIVHIKKEPGRENSKVFLFGCSYAGTMVTWFRQKYPHLAVGAKASSAPLLAKTNFVEYKEIVGASVRSIGGEACYNRIENSFRQAKELAVTNDGFAELEKLFNVCDTFNSSKQTDVWYFFVVMGYVFDGIVQYQKRGDIERECQQLLALQNTTDLEAFAKHFFTSKKFDSKDYCLDIDYDDLIDYYRNIKWNVGSTKYEDRQWTYQTCTEYGYFQTSESPYQPYSGFPVQFDYQKCADFYDDKIFNDKTINGFINRINVIYGARNPSVKNVLFTHGRIDPWRSMGIQYDYSENSPVAIVLNEAHCFDLESINSKDSIEVIAVKERIKQFVRNLLK